MSESVIHLRVPAALKGRWVRLSRAKGVRLTDWIVEAVEGYLMRQGIPIEIPDGVGFADLKLARDATGDVSFDWSPIERICAASGLPIEVFRDSSEDNIAGLIVSWYQAHRADGGPPDAVAEDLITEMIAEERAGQSFSHKPGTA